MKNVLVSGTSSGLGKYLKNKFSATKYKRDIDDSTYLKKKWDLIIICGFYSGNLKTGYEEAVKHIKKLISLQSEKIIFISSLNVNFLKYPIEFKHVKNKMPLRMYAFSKYKCEKLCLKKRKTLVIRLSNIVGPSRFMRKSDLKKFIYTKHPKVKYMKTSKFSLTSFDEILSFIKIACKNEYTGTHNLFRKDMVSLDEVSQKLKKKTNFGKLYFESLSIKKITSTKLFNFKKKRSFEVIKKYISD